MDVNEWVMNWFAEKTEKTKEEIMLLKDENYFSNGLLDSFSFIELLSDLEDAGISLDNEQFEDRRFATISGLISIIESNHK